MSTAAAQLKRRAQTGSGTPANFNRLARIYRWMEWLTFGPILWRCRCEFLDLMKASRTALILGDGDGRFTARLLQSNVQITVEAIDASEAMLDELLKRSGSNADRVRTTAADARGPIPLVQCFDLVVAHFFLDCLTTIEVESLARNTHAQLAPGARWMISEFAIPENRYGRWFALPLVSALYLAFGALTGLKVRRLPRYREALVRAGFELAHERKRLKGLLVSEVWQAR